MATTVVTFQQFFMIRYIWALYFQNKEQEYSMRLFLSDEICKFLHEGEKALKLVVPL